MGRIIHLVFSESAEGSFKQVIKKNKVIDGDKIIALYDNLSNGPLSDLKSLVERKKWWDKLNRKDYCQYYDINSFEENYNRYYSDISEINENDILFFWHGNCDREICGMLYTLYLLKDKEINPYIINVSDEITEHSNGVSKIIIANSASEIVPEKLSVYYELARKIEKEEYKNLLLQWETIKEENSLLRSYKNGKMKSVDEDYFDKDILKFADDTYKKCARIVGEVIANNEPRITDDYIFWRIKELIRIGMISLQGKFGIMREMEICITNEGLKYLHKFPDCFELWNEIKRARQNKLEFINGIKEQGRLEERIKIAVNLLDVLEDDIIADKTGLTVNQVRNLKIKYK